MRSTILTRFVIFVILAIAPILWGSGKITPAHAQNGQPCPQGSAGPADNQQCGHLNTTVLWIASNESDSTGYGNWPTAITATLTAS